MQDVLMTLDSYIADLSNVLRIPGPKGRECQGHDTQKSD